MRRSDTQMPSHFVCFLFFSDMNSKSVYEEEPLHPQVLCSDALSWKAKFYPPPPPRCKQLLPLKHPDWSQTRLPQEFFPLLYKNWQTSQKELNQEEP